MKNTNLAIQYIELISKGCDIYSYNFPKPSSLREVFFAPQRIVRQDGTWAERMQRWLIDNGDFYTRAGKSLNHYYSDTRPTFTNKEAIALYKVLDRNFLVESIAGHSFYILITSMILRFIELFAQSAQNPLNFSALLPKTKEIVNFLITFAVVGSALSLGYVWKDVVVFLLLPIFFQKVLSFKWSNYYRQIHTLSSTKDFELRDFVFKNIQAALIRALPNIFLIFLSLYKPEAFNQERFPPLMTLCKTESEEFSVNSFERGASTIGDIFLEPIVLMVGKMTLDLVYILILKTIDKDADLRDPIGWMFSKFRRQVSSKVSLPEQESYSRKDHKKSALNRQVISRVQDEVLPSEISIPKSNTLLSETKDCTTGSEKREGKKDKLKTHGTAYPKPVTKTNSTNRELPTYINIEVNGYVRTFQKMEDPSLHKEVWGVIIADSVEKQKLTKYERLLSNGSIGGGVRQLTGWSDRYEIGANMDSRLIGKMYDSGVYHSLQSFMHMEEALQFSQELERYGIQDNVSLIVFSSEAKTHKDIARVAGKL